MVHANPSDLYAQYARLRRAIDPARRDCCRPPAQRSPADVESQLSSLIADLMLIRALLLTFLLSGCAENIVVRHIEGANYATFDHPYTEKADAEVRTAAENLCRKSERVAIKSESVCTLATCVTSYQCAGKGDRVK